jgi:excisionase family DNA binding protein
MDSGTPDPSNSSTIAAYSDPVVRPRPDPGRRHDGVRSRPSESARVQASSAAALTVTLALTEEQLDALANRVAEIVLVRAPAPSAPASPFLSVSEASELLRASRQRVYDLLSAGRLTRHKDGSRVLILREEVDRYLRGETVGPVAAALRGGGTGKRLTRSLAPH